MLKRLIRYTRGYLRFRVTGPFPERFINLCTRGGVGLWDTHREEGCITGSTALSHRRQIEYYASKAGAELTILQSAGVQPAAQRYHRRRGLWIGAALLLLGFLVMSRMVWRIEVRGLETLAEEPVLTILSQNGVHAGSWASRINAREVERRMQVSFSEIAWIAVNIEGSTATIVIEEAVVPPAVVEDHVPTNVIAAKTGFITRVEAYDGNAVVAPGDSVQAGQLLISGIMDNGKGESRTAHARGRIYAETRELLTVTIPYRQEKLIYRDVARRSYLTFFGLPVPLQLGGAPAEPYRLDRAVYRPNGILSLLPFTRIEECYLLMERTTYTITAKEAQALAAQQLSTLEKQQLAGCTILSRELTAKQLPDGWELTGEYLCEGEIGTERPISVETGQDSSPSDGSLN